MGAHDPMEAGKNLDQRLTGIEQILPTLATKEDLKPLATKDELREDGERSRRYMKILVEDLKDTIGLYAEHVTALDDRDMRQHAESTEATTALDRRVTELEAASRRRRR